MEFLKGPPPWLVYVYNEGEGREQSWRIYRKGLTSSCLALVVFLRGAGLL